jgi:hypothetical protein
MPSEENSKYIAAQQIIGYIGVWLEFQAPFVSSTL